MKALITALTLLISFTCFSQSVPVDPKTGKVTFVDSVAVPGVSQQEIYSRLREWVAVNCEANKCKVLLEDKPGKLIVIEDKKFNGGKEPVRHIFTYNIAIKNNQLAYQLTNIQINNGVGKPGLVENMVTDQAVIARPQFKADYLAYRKDLIAFAEQVKSEITKAATGK